jgi:hypothetical protein
VRVFGNLDLKPRTCECTLLYGFGNHIYLDNLNEQIKNLDNWNVITKFFFPYEFISEVFNVYMIDKLYDKPTLFSIRYAMHIELVKFLRLSTTLVGAKKIKQIQPIKTLSFSKNDHYGINNMHYIQHGNQDNIYLNLDYTSNLETFVSENLSSIDFITVGTHSSIL